MTAFPAKPGKVRGDDLGDVLAALDVLVGEGEAIAAKGDVAIRVTGKHLAADLEVAIDSHEAGKKTFGGSKLAAAVAGKAKGANAVVAVSPPMLLKLLYASVPEFPDEFRKAAAKIEAGPGALVLAVRTSGNRLTAELSLPAAELKLTAAALEPFIAMARERARNVVCKSNQRGVAIAMLTYSVENGRYPKNLDELLKSGCLPEKDLLLCPASGAKPPAKPTDETIGYVINWNADAKGPVTPLVWDKGPVHEGGRNVAFTDLYVEWLPEKKFQALLKAHGLK